MATQPTFSPSYSDLDETVDQLIENNDALEKIALFPHEFSLEIDALCNMQESLLFRLETLSQHHLS